MATDLAVPQHRIQPVVEKYTDGVTGIEPGKMADFVKKVQEPGVLCCGQKHGQQI